MAELPIMNAMSYQNSTADPEAMLRAVGAFGEHRSFTQQGIIRHNASPEQKEMPTTAATQRRLVQVFILDPDENVPLDKALLYQGKQVMTDLTDQELYYDIDIKSVIEKHNAYRVTVRQQRDQGTHGAPGAGARPRPSDDRRHDREFLIMSDQGSVGILNIGAGDTKLTFDKSNPVESVRAARIVRDMLRRGYALLVEVEKDGKKIFRRAEDFDEETCEYIIADFDPIAAQPEPQKSIADRVLQGFVDKPEADDGEAVGENEGEATAAAAPTAPYTNRTGKRGRPRKIHASTTRAVAVARSAGG